MYTFVAGKGINCTKINSNFTDLQNISNTNETQINTLANTALLKDGSNLTSTIIDEFNTVTPIVLANQSGTIVLQDNKQYFISLAAGATISLPTIASDSVSHTISVVVQGSSYSLDLGTNGKSLGSLMAIDPTKPYQILYIYNKIDNSWYSCLGQ